MRNTKKLLNAGITIKEEVYYYVRVCSWFYGETARGVLGLAVAKGYIYVSNVYPVKTYN